MVEAAFVLGLTLIFVGAFVGHLLHYTERIALENAASFGARAVAQRPPGYPSHQWIRTVRAILSTREAISTAGLNPDEYDVDVRSRQVYSTRSYRTRLYRYYIQVSVSRKRSPSGLSAAWLFGGPLCVGNVQLLESRPVEPLAAHRSLNSL